MAEDDPLPAEPRLLGAALGAVRVGRSAGAARGVLAGRAGAARGVLVCRGGLEAASG